jgi:NAD(P)-dependent dehydrogenase (short-subunit alcohol dehydrogenase family)
MRLQGKRALITGAGSGIGLESARLFAAEGARLALADIDRGKAEAAAADIRRRGGAALAIAADVADAGSVEAMVAEADAGLGGLDILFNNAGILLPQDHGPEETPLEVWHKTLAVNLTGVFLCCKYGIPLLLRGGGGAIVNTASMVALVGSFMPQIAYTATKGGVVAMTRELAMQYARRNIRVNAICPGPIVTPMMGSFLDTPKKRESRSRHLPLGRFGEPREVAQVALFLASDEASLVTGAAYTVDGGATACYLTPQVVAEAV